MATKPTKVVDEVEELEEVEEDEVDETEAFITPKELAAELEIDPKTLRGYLRKEFSRPNEEKNTSWRITEEVADACREHFSKDEELEDDDETDEVEA